MSAALALVGPAAGAAPPPESLCRPAGAAAAGPGRDGLAPVLREGTLVSRRQLLGLRELLPPEVWRLRDVFFHEGMRMEIGRCHRRYPVPAFFSRATERFRGGARLDAQGNLLDHVAGLPFPPESIDPGAPDAGARWAWNAERRYRGAGPVGRFRIVEVAGPGDESFRYRGEWFFLQTSRRADLEATAYALPEAEQALWIAGGRFHAPFDARHLAWRQLRPHEAERRYRKADETFVYVPSMRKTRRAATGWVDGLFTPRYRAGFGDDAGGGIALGGDPHAGVQGAVQPRSGRSAAVTQALRTGFTGLAFRPNAYRWKRVTERPVLAPLDVTREGYPIRPERNFGPSGLSLGDDRWELRHAVVLEGLRRDADADFRSLELWLDWQTQQPLYLITRQAGGRLVDVTILAHRWSGDLPGYPSWPSGEPALVFDPVAAVSWSPLEGGSGWRRESYDLRSVPVDPDQLRRYTSTDYLLRGK